MLGSATNRDLETIVAPRHSPEAMVPVSAIRSTMVQSSLRAVESLGKLDDYYLALPIEFHDDIENLVVGQWLDIRVGLAHYGAIDKLGLSRDLAERNGRLVAEKVQQSYIGTVIKALGSSATVWALLSRSQTAWDRLLKDGALAVYKLGPKEARVDWLGFALARFDYVRYGVAGILAGTLELISPRVRVDVDRARSTDDRIVYHVSWV